MKTQRGATLVVILILVLMIALLGSYTVRNSLSSLNIATHSQIQALLFQSADAALFRIEDPVVVSRQLAQDGVFNYFSSALNAQDELVFCDRAQSRDFFLLAQASAITLSGSTEKRGITGFCKASDFSTARRAVLTQIYLSKNLDSAAPLSQLIQGSSLGQAALPVAAQQVRVAVIAILPSFSSATSAQIESCFKQRSAQVAQCFNQLNVPYNMLHSSYAVESQAKLKL